MTLNFMDKKHRLRFFVVLAMMLVLLPSVSAFQWCDWIPFWSCEDDLNGYTLTHSPKWVHEYENGIQEEYFDTIIENLDNGKAKVCLVPKELNLRINDDIIQESKATLRNNGVKTGEVEPSDMEVETEGGKVKKMCVDVDIVNEDTIKFGEHSSSVSYVDDNLEIKNDSEVVVQDVALTYNTDYCLTDCEARGTSVLYQNDELFNGYDFVNTVGSLVNLSDVKIYVGQMETFNNTHDTYNPNCSEIVNATGTFDICNPFVNGSVTEYYDEIVYEEYNFETLEAGSYYWKILAKKSPYSSVDWAVSLQGFETDIIRQYWAWWNSDWDYKRLLSNLTGEYPTLNLSFETGKMNGNFSDVRFLDSTETVELNYTIRDYVDSDWFTVTIETNNVTGTNNTFYMYYGNPAVSTSTSDINATFKTPHAYYFLDETTPVDATGVFDATGNGTLVSGHIGNYHTYDASTKQYETLPGDFDDSILTDFNPNVSFSLWFKHADGTVSANEIFFGAGRAGGGGGIQARISGGSEDIQWTKLGVGGSPGGALVADVGDIDTGWHHLFNIANTTGMYIYYDGSYVSVTHANVDSFISLFAGQDIRLGAYANDITVQNFFDGGIDEFVVFSPTSGVTPDTVAEYYSMSDQTNTYILGAEESGTLSPVITLIEPLNNAYDTDGNVFFNCTGTYNTGMTALNMTFDGNVVAQVTNSSQSENLTATYTNASIPDGVYTWNCNGVSVDNTTKTSTTYTLNVDSNAPVVNITAPTNGTIITQPNESFDFNWTVTELNATSCVIEADNYQFIDNDSNLTTYFAWTGGGFTWYNFTDAGLQGTTADWFYNNGVSFQKQAGFSYSNWTAPSDDINCMNDEFTSPVVYVNATNVGKYVCFRRYPSEGGQNVVMKIENTSALLWAFDNLTVDCNANTTTFNYPNESIPSSITFTLTATDWFNYTSSNSTTIVTSTIAPNITITSPVTLYDTLTDNDTVDLNFSITNTTILDDCWYEYDGSNNTISCLTNTNFNYITGINSLTLYANDSFGNLGSETVSWVVLAATQSIIYESEVIETDQTEFVAVINLSTGVLSVTGNLVYDGTSYSAIPTVTGNQTNLTRTINVPLVAADENKSFYFNLNITTVNGSGVATSPVNNQTVYNLELTRCDAGDPQEVIRYTTRDARSPFGLLNTTLASSWFYYLYNGTGSVVQNISYQDTVENDSRYTFCLNFNETIVVNNQVEVEATDYVPSSNFLVAANLSQDSFTNQTIYLLNSSLADATVLRVFDQAGFYVPNVLINVQYYDIGTNSFITVTQASTSSIGSDVVYLNWLDSLYKFVLVKDGETVETTLPENIFESPRDFTLGEDTVFEFEKFQDIDYNLYYTNSTQDFYLTYSRPDGKFTEGCLRVTKKNAAGDTLICDTCSTAASATLLCNIASYGNGTYIATFYATGSPASGIDWILEIVGGSFSQTIGDALGAEDSTFYAFMLGILVVGVMFVNPVAGIVAALLALFISSLLGFVVINYLTLMGIVITGGIIAWLIRG